MRVVALRKLPHRSVHVKARSFKEYHQSRHMPLKHSSRLQFLWDVAQATLGRGVAPTPQQMEALQQALGTSQLATFWLTKNLHADTMLYT